MHKCEILGARRRCRFWRVKLIAGKRSAMFIAFIVIRRSQAQVPGNGWVVETPHYEEEFLIPGVVSSFETEEFVFETLNDFCLLIREYFACYILRFCQIESLWEAIVRPKIREADRGGHGTD